MNGRLRLGVIFGGRSVEHEVSVVSAMEVMKAADPARFDVVPFGVTRDGRWLTPDETRAQLAREDRPYEKRIDAEVPPLVERPDVLREIGAVDAMFPLVHGVNGEDGTLQGMLEMFGIAYAGCGVTASALGMDKALQKDVLAHAGLRVAPHVQVRANAAGTREGEYAAWIEETTGYPAFVKPANGGSSVGVSKVRSREDLPDAMKLAFGIDQKVIVERAIDGRELECGVIGYDPPQASPVGEVIAAGEFYDYAAKYLEDSARLVAPAELDERAAGDVRDSAVRAFEAIDGGNGFARVDFFLRPDGELLVNEINTIPGFTPISMFPRLWALAGVSYGDLIGRLVDLGVDRLRRREALGA